MASTHQVVRTASSGGYAGNLAVEELSREGVVIGYAVWDSVKGQWVYGSWWRPVSLQAALDFIGV